MWHMCRGLSILGGRRYCVCVCVCVCVCARACIHTIPRTYGACVCVWVHAQSISMCVHVCMCTIHVHSAGIIWGGMSVHPTMSDMLTLYTLHSFISWYMYITTSLTWGHQWRQLFWSSSRGHQDSLDTPPVATWSNHSVHIWKSIYMQ